MPNDRATPGPQAIAPSLGGYKARQRVAVAAETANAAAPVQIVKATKTASVLGLLGRRAAPHYRTSTIPLFLNAYGAVLTYVGHGHILPILVELLVISVTAEVPPGTRQCNAMQPYAKHYCFNLFALHVAELLCVHTSNQQSTWGSEAICCTS